MQNLGIYLVMNGNCEEAFIYYQSVFGGTLAFSRYSDAPQNPHATKTKGNLIMNVTFKTENFDVICPILWSSLLITIVLISF